jgi:PPM family protein phosphatase
MAVASNAVASYTHVGRRRSNQDAVVVTRLSSGADLVAVADGMGGHSAGEIASAMTLQVLVAELENGASLKQAIDAANTTVFERSRERPEWHGMGTTLVVLLRSGTSYQIANVGDSRAYVIGARGIEQVTEDHSYVAEALRSGAMTEAEAVRSPWRNALTRAIGTEESVEVDVFGPFPIADPHAVLLCSDGLYKAVSSEVIYEYVLSTGDLATAVEVLSALAFRRGSDDNITVAAVEFASLARRSPTVTLPLPIRLQLDGRNGARAAARSSVPSVAPATQHAASARDGTSAAELRLSAPAAREAEPAARKRRARRRRKHPGRWLAWALLVLALAAVIGWLIT